MNLFDITQQESTPHRRENEDTYSYFCRTTHPTFARMRSVFENWFDNIHEDSDRFELKQMIKNDFDAGFLELLLHELFLRMGYTVEFHPTITDRNMTPDFRVHNPEGSFLVEAKCIGEYPDNVKSLVTLRNNLYNTLDCTPSPDYVFIVKDLEIKRKKSPLYRKIKACLNKALEEVDYDTVRERAHSGGRTFRYEYDFEYEDENTLVKIDFLPRSRKHVKGKSRNLAMWGGITRGIDHEPILRKAIRSKAKKYRELQEPYLIVINALNRHAQFPRDFRNALFGTASVEEVIQNKPLSNHKGALFNHSGAQYSNVSAVMGFTMNQNMIHSCQHHFYNNPNAEYELPKLPLVTHDMENKILNEDMGMSIGEALGVSKDWLKIY